MAEDTWFTIALPMLEFLNDVEPLTLVNIGELADALGAEPMAVVREADRLFEAGYMSGSVQKMMTGGDPRPWFIQNPELAERGARAIGVWPANDPYDVLIQLLERQIAAEPDDDRRSKLQRFVAALTDVGKGVATGVLVELVKSGLH